eukprot:TRINITY_DN13498_c0_g1_i1.p1 TRINITY_DN13498_c0_g1~~TRINITY_DN13498_c0_g1_i1.p1  ORF type:complete len:124 (+),score=13.91 TRINITY_DN13498_c0_g1_i1:69-440(+)
MTRMTGLTKILSTPLFSLQLPPIQLQAPWSSQPSASQVSHSVLKNAPIIPHPEENLTKSLLTNTANILDSITFLTISIAIINYLTRLIHFCHLPVSPHHFTPAHLHAPSSSQPSSLQVPHSVV